MTAAEYFSENNNLFEMTFICSFLDFFDNADSVVTVNRMENVSHVDIELDYCITVTAEACNWFDDITLIIQFSFGENRKDFDQMKELCSSLLAQQLAVIVKSEVLALVDDEIAIYDPSIKPLGFQFE